MYYRYGDGENSQGATNDLTYLRISGRKENRYLDVAAEISTAEKHFYGVASFGIADIRELKSKLDSYLNDATAPNWIELFQELDEYKKPPQEPSQLEKFIMHLTKFTIGGHYTRQIYLSVLLQRIDSWLLINDESCDIFNSWDDNLTDWLNEAIEALKAQKEIPIPPNI